jgi:hypothetical protein
VTPLWLAAAWLVLGALGAALHGVPRLRLGVALSTPAALLLLCLLSPRVGAAPAPLLGASPALGREAVGLLVAATAAIWLVLLLSESLDGMEVLGIGAVGGATVLLLGARSPLLFGVAALLGVAALYLRWQLAAPDRSSLATGRVGGIGAVALLAASILLPVSPDSAAAGPLVAGLLATGVMALVALVPLGGWAAGAMGMLRAPEIAIWLLLLAPAVLLSAATFGAGLPPVARLEFDHALLGFGLASGLWAGAMALRSRAAGGGVGRGAAAPLASDPQRIRYQRIALGDLALVAVAIGTGQTVASDAALILILTHLIVGPLLLQTSGRALHLPRRVLWLALSGLPPAPSFWGRLLVMEACAGVGLGVAVVCLIALGALTLAAVLGVAREAGSSARGASIPHLGVAWAAAAAAGAVGVVPVVAIHLVFGPGG